MAKRKSKYHLERDEGGRALVECNGPARLRFGPLESGVPLRPGEHLGRVKPSGDGVHFDVELDEGCRSGPVQVSTEKYRTGWETAFGRRGVN